MDKYQKHFESRFNDLIKFKKANDRWPSPISDDFTERSIGVWYVKIKLSYSKGKLEEGRQKAFEKIRFPLNYHDHQWNRKVKRLKLFIKKIKEFQFQKNIYMIFPGIITFITMN